MKHSRLYSFILNQWIIGKDETYVNSAFEKGYIAQVEKETILSTPQIN